MLYVVQHYNQHMYSVYCTLIVDRLTACLKFLFVFFQQFHETPLLIECFTSTMGDFYSIVCYSDPCQLCWHTRTEVCDRITKGGVGH